MGRDKAGLGFGGARLVDHMVALVSRAVAGRGPVRVSGSVEGHACIADERPGLGPLGGIASALARAPEGARVLFVPVDMPLLPAEFLERLLAAAGEAAVAFEGRELPAVIVNTAKARETIAAACAESAPARARSVRALLRALAARELEAPVSVPERAFANANTPGEWKEISP